MRNLLNINDSPHRIALGLSVGVFIGVMPGLGVIAALVLATFFKLNKVATVLGAFITNTWLSVVIFLLSIRLGSAIMNLRWQDVYNSWLAVFKGFNFKLFLKAIFSQTFLPVALGYLVISLAIGFITYLITFYWLTYLKKKKGPHDA